MKRLLLIIFLVFAIRVFSPGVSLAVESDTLPCYHEALNNLSFLIGDWELTSNFRLASGKWEHTAGVSSIINDFHDCMITEGVKSTRDGHPFEARAHFTYNSFTKSFQKLWIDSEHGLMVLYEANTEGKPYVFENELTIGDRTIQFRHTYVINHPDTVIFQSQRSNDGGVTWDTGWEITYRRKSVPRHDD